MFSVSAVRSLTDATCDIRVGLAFKRKWGNLRRRTRPGLDSTVLDDAECITHGALDRDRVACALKVQSDSFTPC